MRRRGLRDFRFVHSFLVSLPQPLAAEAKDLPARNP
uniref:Uncharacterized protein n=1 Tax=Rhizophora mucronata TaxID=61149 RepID=A0A2P2PZS3_RHIMU